MIVPAKAGVHCSLIFTYEVIFERVINKHKTFGSVVREENILITVLVKFVENVFNLGELVEKNINLLETFSQFEYLEVMLIFFQEHFF